jgi:hypothetical protein
MGIRSTIENSSNRAYFEEVRMGIKNKQYTHNIKTCEELRIFLYYSQ